jgi:hypothetical protein
VEHGFNVVCGSIRIVAISGWNDDALQYLTEISQAAYFHLERNYLSAFGQINSKIDEDLKEFSDEEKEKKQKDHHLYQLGQKLEADVEFVQGRHPFVRKMALFFGTAVSFQVLTITKTSSEVIGDVKELQLLCLDGHKSVVALHGVLDEVPNVSQLPPHEAFFSTLKNENISAEDYQMCQTVWEDNDMKTMKEFLIWK